MVAMDCAGWFCCVPCGCTSLSSAACLCESSNAAFYYARFMNPNLRVGWGGRHHACYDVMFQDYNPVYKYCSAASGTAIQDRRGRVQ